MSVGLIWLMCVIMILVVIGRYSPEERRQGWEGGGEGKRRERGKRERKERRKEGR